MVYIKVYDIGINKFVVQQISDPKNIPTGVPVYKTGEEAERG